MLYKLSLLVLAECILALDPGVKVYVYDLPAQFNYELYDKVSCGSHERDSGHYFNGMGSPALSPDRDTLRNNDPHTYEIVIHDRMISYQNRVSSKADADLFYVPFYIGYAFHEKILNPASYPGMYEEELISLSVDLLNHLRDVEGVTDDMWSKHIITIGREEVSFYGGKFNLFEDPDLEPMTKMLRIHHQEDCEAKFDEGRSYNHMCPSGHNFEVVVAPGIASVHATTGEPFPWEARHNRPYLATFVGNTRRNMDHIIDQLTPENCDDCLLETGEDSMVHDGPTVNELVDAYTLSEFCLHPAAGSPTGSLRREIYDSIALGCIPVFFAHTRMPWDTFINYNLFSVWIEPAAQHDVIETLRKLSTTEKNQLREGLNEYAQFFQWSFGAPPIMDAFDLLMKEISYVSEVRASTKDRENYPEECSECLELVGTYSYSELVVRDVLAPTYRPLKDDCNIIEGWSRNIELLDVSCESANGYYLGSSAKVTVGSFSECCDVCDNIEGCKHFAFKSNGFCLTYTALTGMVDNPANLRWNRDTLLSTQGFYSGEVIETVQSYSFKNCYGNCIVKQPECLGVSYNLTPAEENDCRLYSSINGFAFSEEWESDQGSPYTTPVPSPVQTAAPTAVPTPVLTGAPAGSCAPYEGFYWKGTFKQQTGVASFDECCAVCSLDLSCVHFSWRIGGRCWKFSAITGLIAANRLWFSDTGSSDVEQLANLGSSEIGGEVGSEVGNELGTLDNGLGNLDREHGSLEIELGNLDTELGNLDNELGNGPGNELGNEQGRLDNELGNELGNEPGNELGNEQGRLDDELGNELDNSLSTSPKTGATNSFCAGGVLVAMYVDDDDDDECPEKCDNEPECIAYNHYEDEFGVTCIILKGEEANIIEYTTLNWSCVRQPGPGIDMATGDLLADTYGAALPQSIAGVIPDTKLEAESMDVPVHGETGSETMGSNEVTELLAKT